MVIPVMDLFFLGGGVLFLFVVSYLFFLAAASLWPEGRREREYPPTVRFAVVIPAHNESRVILGTLKSLEEQSYPRGFYEVIVVADNCVDDTAEIVRRAGVTCWERTDLRLHGKGHVLRWAFDRLLEEGDHGAYVVIDADTLADRDFLAALNQRLRGGAKVVQGYYDVLQPERSPMSSLSYLGFLLSRNLRYKGRTRLGWTTNLLGNGMCFTREVIGRFGWCATSIVEDIEYEMILHLNGIRVMFAPEARVYAEIPDTFDKSRIQRGRWDLGKFQIRNAYLSRLVREGFRNRDWSYFDSAMELLIPPFSLFILLVLTVFSFYLVLGFRGFDLNFFIWTFVVAGLGIYIMGGLMLARTGWKVYRNLLYAPYFLLWRLWVVFRGAWRKSHQSWLKTERG